MNNSLIISLLFLIVGCSRLIDEPSLIEKNGVMYLPQSDKPYSGDVSKSDNFGKTLLKGTYKNGKKDGLWTEWDENGQKKSEGKFEDDKKDDLWKDYYENGQLQEEGHYKEGKYEGLWIRYFDNGILSIKGNYKDDKQDGFWKSYYDNGQLKYEWNYKEGELISQECWDEDGNEKECD